MKEIVVQKYGGSSLATLEMMEKVAAHIRETIESGKMPIAVVSAMGKETDRLIETVRKFHGGYPPVTETDKVQATGENLSASLLAIALHKAGISAESLTGWQIGLETDPKNRHKIKRIRNIERAKEVLAQEKALVITGFQGIKEGTDEITTLGRGGSDLTAIALAGALGLEYCEIYTDVDGVYAVNPHIVPEAKRFDKVTYDMMIELSARGAKVLMDRSVELARKLNVRVQVKLSPSLGKSTGGTLICAHTGNLQDMETSESERTGVAIQENLAAITISNIAGRSGIAGQIFGALSDINLVDAAQVPVKDTFSVLILCQEEDLNNALAKLKPLNESLPEIEIDSLTNLTGLTLVSPLMKEGSSYMSRFADAMKEAEVNIEMIASSGTTILFIIKDEKLEQAALSLANKFSLID
jgi:aspartate kinase